MLARGKDCEVFRIRRERREAEGLQTKNKHCVQVVQIDLIEIAKSHRFTWGGTNLLHRGGIISLQHALLFFVRKFYNQLSRVIYKLKDL